ncbi:MAG: T9SS type A sorting domain-containing protein [Lewinellaceae bacterium]|nr:T9SS type A sorting domain-containing protein [Saprospiraceae bacterium]MCB9337923.1 T9SS type A sorting domain-containing protein [Lewinellaceae bacterium]
MTIRIHPFLPFFFLLAAISAYAQPGQRESFPYGCHHTKSRIPLEALPLQDDRDASCGSNARSDSIDILNYAVTLDLTEFDMATVHAECEVTFTVKEDGIGVLPLDLLKLTVDSVKWQNTLLNYEHDGVLLNVTLPALVNIGDTMEVVVYYQGKPYAQTTLRGFGGFYFEGGYAYNLGINLNGVPYNFGRSWHPCFDNFVERATYDINIITNGGRKGYAIGDFLGETDLGGGEALRQYRMDEPLPTYLAGFAAANYAAINEVHEGQYGTYPILIVGKPADTMQLREDFSYVGDAVDAFESWFGPYNWHQVGYAITSRGAMEHATLIAYPEGVTGNGPTPNFNALMAHELAHHWWGNVTTMSCPENMWIKEGNAEYSSHLFTEYKFGKEAFLDQVKDNHYNTVLRNAFKDDDGFWPLSGIPYEYTYGTTTYYGGASMMHNLRGYLGDTLFSKGMTSILETYKYESVDAELFRDQLTAATGVDMTSFFDDWIFSPGFACYELDSVRVEPTAIPEEWKATVHVQQKLRAAPHFHTNAPVSITFYDENWNTYTTQFMMSGEFGSADLTVPFQPVWQILNDDNRLNLARVQDKKVEYGPGTVKFDFAEIYDFEILQSSDSALLSAVHYWAGADPISPNPTNVKVSDTHFWRLGGILPADFVAKGRFSYSGTNTDDFDYNLLQNTDDSLILIWRPNPSAPWLQYPFYTKQSFNGKFGRIYLDNMLPGDYAFAYGDLPMATALSDQIKGTARISVYPNPASEQFSINGVVPGAKRIHVALYDMVGKMLKQSTVRADGGIFQCQMDIPGLAPGMYLVKAGDEDGRLLKTEKLVKN